MMRVKGLLIALIVLTAVKLQAQDTYKTATESDGQKVLTGKITEKMLANDPSFSWFYTGVNKYNPDPQMVKYISAYRDSFNIVVFAGTWCPDTHKLLPQFYRVMLASSYPVNRIELYGVDRNYKALGNEPEQWGVKRVPTFIILHNGKEVGRIVETVHRSIESDIVGILDKMIAQDEGAKN